MRKIYMFLFVVLTFAISQSLTAQTHFSPVSGGINTGGQMNLNLMEAKVNGINLEAGDEIGFFDGEFCVGVAVLTEGLEELWDAFVMPGIADVDDSDTPEKDGFTNGNTISYRFWDASEEEEITNVVPTYYNVQTQEVIDPAPVFQDGNSAFVSLMGTHNYKPVANAGIDFSIDEKTNGSLDGSGSSDPEGEVLTYLWEDLDGLGLMDLSVANPAFTAPDVTEDTEYRVVLTVNDGERDSEPDTVIVTVINVPLPPVANAGTDFEIIEGEAGQLNGSASSDPDGLDISYSWEIVPAGITLSDPNVVNPTFTAPTVTVDTEYVATLTVTNTIPLSSTATVTITVKDFNRKPVAVPGVDQQVDENVLVTLDGSGSYDPDDGDVITYLWTAPAGITFDGDPTAPVVTFTSPVIVEDFFDFEFTLVVNDGKLDSDPAIVVVRVIHENIPPVAVAGLDQTVDEGDLVQLDGTGSSDFENKPLAYSWTAPAEITLDDPTSATPSFIAPEVHENTNFELTLVVNDGVWNSVPDAVVITVLHINKPPVADAGPDQTVDEGSLVQLDGTGSFDPDQLDVITYLWTSLDGATLDDNTLAQPTFTAPEFPELISDKTFRFVLVVNDGFVDSESDTVSVLVVHINLPPVADAGTSFSINENEQGQLNGSGSYDPEGADLTYLWIAADEFVIDDPTAESPTFTAPEVEEDTQYAVYLTVNDGQDENNTAMDMIVVTVLQVNKPPVADAGSDFSIREQRLAMLDGTASYDPDALDNITYNWIAPAGVTLDDPTSATPSFTAPDVTSDTELVFTLEVTDESLETVAATVTVTVTANKAPVANAGTNKQVYSDNLVTLDGTGSSDPDGDMLTYQWTGPAEITLTGDDSTNPTFTAPKIDGQEDYTFTLVVTDDLGLTDEATVTITVVGNLPPVIVTATVVEVTEGETITLDASETYDPDGDDLVYAWSTLYVNQADLIIFGDTTSPVTTVTVPMVDEFTIIKLRLRVNDGLERVTEIIELHISKKVNNAPVANAGTDITVNEGETFILDGSASADPDGDEITFLWSVEEMTIDNPTLEILSLTAPEVAEDMTILAILFVNDGELDSQPDTVLITIVNVNKAPVAVAGEDIAVNEGEEFTLNGSGSFDPDGDEITYMWSVGDLTTDDLTLEMISGIAPEVEEDITVPVILIVNDGELDSQPDTVYVTILQVNKAPEFIPVEDITADIGYGFSVDIQVTDPDMLDELTIFADNLPEWLILTDNGDGTAVLATDSIPRVESLLGEHIFTIKASDGTETVETTVKLTISIRTGIENLSISNLRVFPNPTSGLLDIQFNSMPERETRIQVYNLAGQTILMQQTRSQNTVLDLSANPAGIYYIKISSEKISKTEKIILR